jgi:cytochrome c553
MMLNTGRVGMRTLHSASLAVFGIALGSVFAGADSAIANPRSLTIEACAACHGEEGIARDTEVPHLAGQNERYLYNQMLAFRSGRRQHR